MQLSEWEDPKTPSRQDSQIWEDDGLFLIPTLGKAQNCINKLQNSIEWDLFPFPYLPGCSILDLFVFLCLWLYIACGFLSDFAPPSGSVKDGAKRAVPPRLSVVCGWADRPPRSTVTTPRPPAGYARCGRVGSRPQQSLPLRLQGKEWTRHRTTQSSRSLKHQSSGLGKKERGTLTWSGILYRSWNFKSKPI